MDGENGNFSEEKSTTLDQSLDFSDIVNCTIIDTENNNKKDSLHKAILQNFRKISISIDKTNFKNDFNLENIKKTRNYLR